MRTLSISLSLLVFVGCGSSGVEGSVTDEDGNPVADVTVKLTAVEEVGMTCQQFGAPTDEAGKFAIDGVCTNQTSYNIKLSDDSLWLAAGGVIAKDNEGALDLVVTHHGGGPGIYHAKTKTSVGNIRTASDLKKTKVGDTDILYTKKADKAFVLAAGEWLLINGDDKLATYKFATLKWAAGPLKLGSGDSTLEVAEGDGIWVVGGDLTADGFTATEVTPDAAKITNKKGGDVSLSYIAGDALPAGRYVYFTKGARRPYMIDFGQALPAPAAAPE